MEWFLLTKINRGRLRKNGGRGLLDLLIAQNLVAFLPREFVLAFELCKSLEIRGSLVTLSLPHTSIAETNIDPR